MPVCWCSVEPTNNSGLERRAAKHCKAVNAVREEVTGYGVIESKFHNISGWLRVRHHGCYFSLIYKHFYANYS